MLPRGRERAKDLIGRRYNTGLGFGHMEPLQMFLNIVSIVDYHNITSFHMAVRAPQAHFLMSLRALSSGRGSG